MKGIIRTIFQHKTVIVGAIVVASMTLVAAYPANRAHVKRVSQKKYAEGEILVKFREGTSSYQATSRINAKGDIMKKSLPGARNTVLVKIEDGRSVEEAVEQYKSDPSVAHAQPNYRYYMTAAPNDTDYGELWGLKNTGQTVSDPSYTKNNPGKAGCDMDAEPAWDELILVAPSSAAVVAVVDTGVNYNHDELIARMWDDGSGHAGYDCVDEDSDPMDENGHGTHVSGIIAAQGDNANGVTGICWNAPVEIMAVRVLDESGVGYTSDIIQGINWAVANNAHVINMSLGGENPFDASYAEAIEDARTAGVLVVVAAGNGGMDGRADNNDGPGEDGDPSTKFYPCAFEYDNLICVAALDQSYALSSFSNYGKTSVDVGAPGTNILSSVHANMTTYYEDFHADGSSALDWTQSSSGSSWVHKVIDGYDMLVIPSTFPSGSYLENTDSRVYKNFPLSGADDTVSLLFGMYYNTESGYDYIRVNYINSASNPFSGGTQLVSASGYNAWDYSYSLTSCLGSTNCSVGFRFSSDDTTNYQGVSVIYFLLEAADLDDTNAYDTWDGTSMATPYAAGIAAMVKSYNPSYDYLDLAAALKNGEPAIALKNKTTTGTAVNALRSLRYLRAPENVNAVQP